ncbi:cell wall hydrolase [Clostridioides sp. ZZV15-6598]|uniref:cell wall hydrolase n=1 Tax=Clostridioides sp. ZZV15-6598 TaxID=2811501 RepID=UPI001D11FF96|nr:cell wall hydrolase [Clostridioides sp. ZZV15-6598]
MDRWSKLIAILLALTYIFIPIKEVFADEPTETVKKVNKQEQNVAKKEVINLSDNDLMLLSKLVAGEARGESYEGQVAVAAVVINRVLDPRFPDSIEEVIYQKNAFSVVLDGSINRTPTDSACKAAKEALYGTDPTHKAVYFWNPEIATCKWINRLNPYLRIGNHVFAK